MNKKNKLEYCVAPNNFINDFAITSLLIVVAFASFGVGIYFLTMIPTTLLDAILGSTLTGVGVSIFYLLNHKWK